jgi:hypothetical protein
LRAASSWPASAGDEHVAGDERAIGQRIEEVAPGGAVADREHDDADPLLKLEGGQGLPGHRVADRELLHADGAGLREHGVEDTHTCGRSISEARRRAPMALLETTASAPALRSLGREASAATLDTMRTLALTSRAVSTVKRLSLSDGMQATSPRAVARRAVFRTSGSVASPMM